MLLPAFLSVCLCFVYNLGSCNLYTWYDVASIHISLPCRSRFVFYVLGGVNSSFSDISTSLSHSTSQHTTGHMLESASIQISSPTANLHQAQQISAEVEEDLVYEGVHFDMFCLIGFVGSRGWTIWKSYYPEPLLLSPENDVRGTTEHRVGFWFIFRIRSSLAELQVVFYKIEEE